MTISRCDSAKAMLQDVIARWADWTGELQTVTGYECDDYRLLQQKLFDSNAQLGDAEEAMLTEAAKQFFGYPEMTTKNVETTIGVGWKQVLREAFLSERKP